MILRRTFVSIVLFGFFGFVPSAAATEVKFSKSQIKIGGKTITVEIADTDAKRERGLMHRTTLAQDTGMLFIFDQSRQLGFWMKNTLIPLSIGYFDSNRALIETFEMVPAIAGLAHPKIYSSTRPARYALEMPKGWFAANNIAKGTRFEFLSRR